SQSLDPWSFCSGPRIISRGPLPLNRAAIAAAPWKFFGCFCRYPKAKNSSTLTAVQLSPRPRTAPDERKRLPSSFGRFHRRLGGARPGGRKAAKAEKGARGGSHALEAL